LSHIVHNDSFPRFNGRWKFEIFQQKLSSSSGILSCQTATPITFLSSSDEFES
jgi:hypothetical protein